MRYDNRGKRVEAAAFGDPRGMGGSGSDPRSDGKTSISGVVEYANLSHVKGSGLYEGPAPEGDRQARPSSSGNLADGNSAGGVASEFGSSSNSSNTSNANRREASFG